jgi:hypothetical protein
MKEQRRKTKECGKEERKRVQILTWIPVTPSFSWFSSDDSGK